MNVEALFLVIFFSPSLLVVMNGGVVFSNDNISCCGKFTFIIILSGMGTEIRQREITKLICSAGMCHSLIALMCLCVCLYFCLSITDIVYKGSFGKVLTRNLLFNLVHTQK